MWIYYNPNPVTDTPTGDCTVRAISKALGISWDHAHDLLTYQAKLMGRIQNNNAVFGAVLRRNGFLREAIPNTCPDCYTVQDFCDDHPYGLYVLGTGSHVVCIIDGDYYDSWNSGMELPQFFWYREE